MTEYTDLKARLAAYAHDTACILCGCPVLELNSRDQAICCRCFGENPLDKKGRAIIEALAAIEELEARNQWQPIETAPKDGTEFLTYAKGNPKAMYERDREPALVISKWKNDCFWRNRPDNMPKHWMPLPQPPETTNDRA